MSQKPINFPKCFFVTGTDTDVGKTIISSLLAIGLKSGYWKPIQAGTLPATDKELVQKYTQLPDHHFFPERYLLKATFSPHLAASLENIEIDLNDFTIPNHAPLSHLIIEGAGGVLVPINKKGDLVADQIFRLDIPVLIVARSSLGTINHTLLTIQALRAKDINILGVILNGNKNEENSQAIATFGKVPVLAEIEPFESITPKALQEAYVKNFGGTL